MGTCIGQGHTLCHRIDNDLAQTLIDYHWPGIGPITDSD